MIQTQKSDLHDIEKYCWSKFLFSEDRLYQLTLQQQNLRFEVWHLSFRFCVWNKSAFARNGYVYHFGSHTSQWDLTETHTEVEDVVKIHEVPGQEKGCKTFRFEMTIDGYYQFIVFCFIKCGWIINMDQTLFCFWWIQTDITYNKEDRMIHVLSSTDENKKATVLVFITASGDKLPWLVICKRTKNSDIEKRIAHISQRVNLFVPRK